MTKLFMHSVVPTAKSIIGSYLGPLADYTELLSFCAEHKVTPMVELVPLAEANTAVAKVKSGEVRYRMVLQCGLDGA